jgi:calcium-dependent protein kinase
LTFDELKKGLKYKENGETLLELMKSADTDGSGEINYTEFLAATMSANVVMREDYLRTAF